MSCAHRLGGLETFREPLVLLPLVLLKEVLNVYHVPEAYHAYPVPADREYVARPERPSGNGDLWLYGDRVCARLGGRELHQCLEIYHFFDPIRQHSVDVGVYLWTGERRSL